MINLIPISTVGAQNNVVKHCVKQTFEIKYNKVQHQQHDSECGIYAINYILQCLRGLSMKVISTNVILDEEINKCREKFFIITPTGI